MSCAVPEIDGPATGIALSGDHKDRIETIDSGATLTIRNLTLEYGSAGYGGAVVVNSGGTFNVYSSTFFLNAVWREAGEVQDEHHAHDHGHHDHPDHAHVHGPDCDHDHHKPGHVHGPDCEHTHGDAHAAHDHSPDDHGHSHDLTWVFARMLVLLFPVALFVLGVPNKGFSPDYLARMLSSEESMGDKTLDFR